MKISKDSLEFLNKLSVNNNREWFEAHKETFKSHQLSVKSVLELIKDGLGETDDIEKLKLFRIYRDVRFSKDKTPYKDYFSASLTRMGNSLRGGYYIHLKPGDAFLAVGFWDPNKEDLFRIRKEIETDASDFKDFLKDPLFKKLGVISLERPLKLPQKDFQKIIQRLIYSGERILCLFILSLIVIYAQRSLFQIQLKPFKCQGLF